MSRKQEKYVDYTDCVGSEVEEVRSMKPDLARLKSNPCDLIKSERGPWTISKPLCCSILGVPLKSGVFDIQTGDMDCHNPCHAMDTLLPPSRSLYTGSRKNCGNGRLSEPTYGGKRPPLARNWSLDILPVFASMQLPWRIFLSNI